MSSMRLSLAPAVRESIIMALTSGMGRWGALLLATAATVRICNLNAPQSVALDAGAPSAPPHAR